MTDENFFLDLFSSKEKAIHHCLWLNFKYRITKIKFGVIHGPDNDWAVVEEATANEMEMPFLEILPNDYADMSYEDIRLLQMDKDPLPHMEKLLGEVATIDGEILRWILFYKIPLEKLIRFELGSRGYDENHRWCGFSKSYEVWLKS
tara:strand:- start:81282 stop:81722 length:441 start_codon:yes stop_codon:yes gene_type:complete